MNQLLNMFEDYSLDLQKPTAAETCIEWLRSTASCPFQCAPMQTPVTGPGAPLGGVRRSIS